MVCYNISHNNKSLNQEILTKVISPTSRSAMQNNSKAYNVCKFENVENLKSYIEVRGITSKNFEGNSFSCDIWFYPTQDSYTLLNQKNGFSLNVVNNKFHFIFPDGTVIQAINTDQNVPEITKNNWNSIFLSYDGNTIAFYLQGCPLYSEEISSHQVLSTNNDSYKIGGDFTGQIRSVRIYKEGLNNTETDYAVNRYICKCVYDQSKMAELIAWIDFSTGKITNLTDLPLQFTTHNLCYIDNVVQAIATSGSNYAYTINSKLNPICTTDRQHAIFVKFFTRHSSINKQTLFSNGDFYNNDSLIIYLFNSDNGISVGMKIGEQTIEISPEFGIQDYTWNDLLVTFYVDEQDQFKAYFYLNGELYGSADLLASYDGKKGNGAVKLGNAFEMNDNEAESISTPFGGYITTVAVFDQTMLGQNGNTFYNTVKPIEFHKNEPFIYELGLEALYNLDSGNPLELVSGNVILMSNDIKSDSKEENAITQNNESGDNLSFIGSITGTNNSNLETPLYTPYIPPYTYFIEKNSLSKSDQKDLDKFGEVIFGYYEATLGMEVSEDARKTFLYSSGTNYLSSELMRDIKLKNEIPIAAVTGFLSEIFLTKDAATLSMSASLGGVSISGMGASLLTGVIFVAAVAAAVLVAIGIAYVLKIIIDAIQKLINGDDEEDDEIILDCENFSTGAISLLEGRMAALDVSYAEQLFVGEPTWTVGKLKGNPSVFVIDKLLHGTIKLNFVLKSKKLLSNLAITVEIKMKAKTPYGNLFNEFTGIKKDCKIGKNTIELKSTGYNSPMEENIFKYETTYQITAKVNGKSSSSILVTLPMYSIPRTPRKPIGHGKRNAIITEFLDMVSASASNIHAAQVNNKVIQKKEIDISIFKNVHIGTKQMMDNLFNCKTLQYGPAVAYHYRYVDNVTLNTYEIDMGKLQNDYNNARVAHAYLVINCYDYSFILAYGLSLYLQTNINIINFRLKTGAIMTADALYTSGLYHGDPNISSNDPKKNDFGNHSITKYEIEIAPHIYRDTYVDGTFRKNLDTPISEPTLMDYYNTVVDRPEIKETELTWRTFQYIGNKHILFIEEILFPKATKITDSLELSSFI